jgi:hypothetical protein
VGQEEADMSARFNDAAVNEIFDIIVGYALASGRFDHVNQHEPKNAPGHGLTCSVWIQAIKPIRTSGVAATSGVILFTARIYMNFRSQPFDYIDPNVTAATTDLMGTFSSDFQFKNAQVADVRNVDLLGSQGVALNATAGYVEIDRTVFRVMTIQIPVILNDIFMQAA